MKISLDEKGCLNIDHSDLKKFSIHPLWLRERLNTEKYLDQNNYQRLYEPSLLDPEIKFQKYFIEDNILKVDQTSLFSLLRNTKLLIIFFFDMIADFKKSIFSSSLNLR